LTEAVEDIKTHTAAAILKINEKQLKFLLIITCFGAPMIFTPVINPEQLVSWKQDYDLNGYYDIPISVQQTRDGGFIILGRAYEMSGSNYLLIKTDSEGKLAWSTVWGGDFHIHCFGESVYQTEEDGYFVLGLKVTTPSGYMSSRILEIYKFNNKGKIEWSESCDYSGDKSEYYIQVTKKEGYKITLNNVSRTDISGNEIWTKQRRGSLISVTCDGGYVRLDCERINDVYERSYITLTKHLIVARTRAILKR